MSPKGKKRDNLAREIFTFYIYLMKEDILKDAYSPELFRNAGHELIDQLADHLRACLNGAPEKVIQWRPPEAELSFWDDFLREGNKESLYQAIMEHTIHLHHPRYMGHQISPVLPLTGLTSLLSGFLNNGMGVYEMGAGPTAMERIVIKSLCERLGYPENSDGFLTSGGTLANLTALLSARQAVVAEDIWEEGNLQNLGVMVSAEAHYCIDRATRIMGLGAKGIVKVPVDKNFQIRTDMLESCYQDAKDKGMQVFAVVGSAPATATGSYDNLEALQRFAKKRGIWFHVDAAHGGAAIYSDVYRHLLKGAEEADSMVIDGHKMMMMPSITTALLFKEGRHSFETFRQRADYLLDESLEEDWSNLAKRTFECTKYMMSLHWFMILKLYGANLFGAFVTRLYDLGKELAKMIEETPGLEPAVPPMSNIVCFRFISPDHSLEALNRINSNVRQQMLEEGNYYIVQTRISGVHYLRTTLMNPFTTSGHLKGMLETVLQTAEQLLRKENNN